MKKKNILKDSCISINHTSWWCVKFSILVTNAFCISEAPVPRDMGNYEWIDSIFFTLCEITKFASIINLKRIDDAAAVQRQHIFSSSVIRRLNGRVAWHLNSQLWCIQMRSWHSLSTSSSTVKWSQCNERQFTWRRSSNWSKSHHLDEWRKDN